jgi:cytidylate kinase
MPAAGKTAAAEIISQKLHIEALGIGDVLKEIAMDKGYKVTGEGWWDTPEGFKFLQERRGNPEFDKEADRRLLQKIEKGNIVITSYTAPWISKKGIKCWLDATPETRAKRMAMRDSMTIERAREVIVIRDRENYELYKKMYGIELGKDMKPFNIIVDANKITPEQVADEIIQQAAKFEGKR